MKTMYENFKIAELRPAVHTNEEMILDIELDKVFLNKVSLNEARALNLKIGDSVYCYASVVFDDKKEFISIHMDGEVLNDFIYRYGIEGTNVKFTGKFEHIFAVFSGQDIYINDTEVNTYRLMEIM